MKRIVKKNPSLLIYIFIFLLTFLTQFSSIEKEVIDWDESTFYVVSNYVSSGSILYVDYWDGKPPLIFIYLAIFFKIFGANLIVGRLAGDLLIYLSAVLTFKILKLSFNNLVSFTSVIFLIYLYSYEASQPTMTEHLGVFFIVLFFYLYLEKTIFSNYFVYGLLFSLAFNTRNNLGFAALGFFIYLLIERKLTLKKFLNLIFGFLLPILVLSLYFFLIDSFQNYFYMLFKFPLQISTYRMTYSEIVIEINNKLNLENFISIELIIITFLIFTLFFVFKFNLNSYLIFKLNFWLFAFIFLSIVAGGKIYNHYIIQLFPFIAIFIAFGINIFFKKDYLLTALILITLLINLNYLTKGFVNFINYKEIYENYPIKKVSNFVDSFNIDDKIFLALENHLIFFYNKNLTSLKVVHPSNLPNTERYNLILSSLTDLGLTYNDEFKTLLQNKPSFIFCENECNLYLSKDFYIYNYDLVYELEDLKLYKNINDE